MAQPKTDPFANFKAAQREAWASFLPVEVITTIPAAKLVAFAGVESGQRVLDVACGAGQTAIPMARLGIEVTGVDIASNLIETARNRAQVLEGLFNGGTGECGTPRRGSLRRAL